MRKPATPIVLSEAEQETLRSWLRAGTSEQRMVERARIVLAAADGIGTNEIARQLLTRPARVSKWRTRFARDRLVGLVDAPRPGARPAMTSRPSAGSSPPSTGGPRAGMRPGPDPSSPRRSAMSPRTRYGGPCDATGSACDDAGAGAFPPIPRSPPRPPTSSGSISTHPRTRSSCASTRSPGSRPSSDRRAGSACPMGGRSRALPTSTSATGRRRCSPPWKSRAGSSRPATTPAAGGASSSTS